MKTACHWQRVKGGADPLIVPPCCSYFGTGIQIESTTTYVNGIDNTQQKHKGKNQTVITDGCEAY